MKKEMPKILWSKQQVAEYFGVAEMTIDRWRKQGMPWTRAGAKLVRFDIDQVNEWMRENGKE